MRFAGQEINVLDQTSIDAAKAAHPGQGVGPAVMSELLRMIMRHEITSEEQLPAEYKSMWKTLFPSGAQNHSALMPEWKHSPAGQPNSQMAHLARQLTGPRTTPATFGEVLAALQLAFLAGGAAARAVMATTPAEEYKRDDEVTADTLLLLDYAVPIDVVKGWTDPECRQAMEWASLTHLRLSEGEDVDVPSFPAFLQPYELRKSASVLAHTEPTIALDAFSVEIHASPAGPATKSAATRIAERLAGRMPDILCVVEASGFMGSSTSRANAVWVAEVANVIAAELKQVAPADLESHVLLGRQELTIWECEHALARSDN